MPSARARTHAGTAVWAAPLRLAIMAIQATPPSIIAMPSPGMNRQRAVRALTSAKRTVASATTASTVKRRFTRGKRAAPTTAPDRKSTRLNSSHLGISYAVFCLQKKIQRRRRGGQFDFIAPADGRFVLGVSDFIYRGGEE